MTGRSSVIVATLLALACAAILAWPATKSVQVGDCVILQVDDPVQGRVVGGWSMRTPEAVEAVNSDPNIRVLARVRPVLPCR